MPGESSEQSIKEGCLEVFVLLLLVLPPTIYMMCNELCTFNNFTYMNETQCPEQHTVSNELLFFKINGDVFEYLKQTHHHNIMTSTQHVLTIISNNKVQNSDLMLDDVA